MLQTRTSRSSSLALACLLWGPVAALGACHEERPPFDPTRAVTLETAVSPALVGVGERVQIFCTRVNGRGEPLAGGTFAIGVEPTELVYVEGMEMFSHRAGVHQVQCHDPELGLVDATPATLEVLAGPAVRTSIALEPATVAAGEPASVRCVAEDEHGNPAGANLRLEVTPAESVTVDGVSAVSATAVGSYEVLCYAANVDEGARASATLTVVPGAVAGLRLRFEPEQLGYRLLQQVTPIGQGVDAYGNPIAGDVPIHMIDASPAGHHRIVGSNNDKIRFDLEGIYTVTATAVSDPGLTASGELVVDQTRPLLVLTSPERGVVTDTLTTVTLSGSVSDNLGRIGALRVGELAIPVPPEGGDFSFEVPLRYAVNLLDVHALDPWGNEAVATRAVERSSDYFALTERTFESDGVDNALVLVLLQEVFDDFDHDEPVRDDIAHLFEFIVDNLDIASLLPSPLTEFDCIGGKCTIEFDDVTMDDVNVTMTLTPGRIHLRVELVKLVGSIILYFPCDVPVICQQRPLQPLPGYVSTDRVLLETDIFLAIVGGETVARTENTTMEMDGLDVRIEDPTGLGQAAIDLVVTYLREPLIAALEQLVIDLIQNELADALDQLFSALTIDERFEVPSPIPGQPANVIALRTTPKGVDIAPERAQIRLDGLVVAETPQRPREHLGSIKHVGCAPPAALSFPPPAPVVVGLHDDFINQLLFAIWEGGTLTLNLGPNESAALVGEFGLEDATIVVDALLPPVFDSCGADQEKILERVVLGDLWIEAQANFLGEPMHLGLWLLTEAPVTVQFAPNEAGALVATLVLGELDPMWIEVITNEGRFAGNDEAVISLVQGTLVPQLLSSFTEGASFELPSIDLGSLTSAVPAGTVINIDVREVARDNAYLTIEGAFYEGSAESAP